MKMCLRVLTERNKLASIISHITFRDCRMHIFSDTLSRNSCKRRRALVMHQPDQPAPQALRLLHGRSERETPVTGDDGTGTDGRRIHGQTGRSTNGTQNFRPGIAFTISVQISSIFQKTTAKAWTRFQRWLWIASPQTSFGVRLSRIHFFSTPKDVCGEARLWRNGTRISDLVQWNIWIFRPEKQDYLFRRFLVPGNFPIERPKSRIPFTFQPDFPEILVNGRQPEFNTGEACCLISLLPLRAHWRIRCLIAWLFHSRLCLLLSCLPYQ